jgi:hypothetical protein
MKPRRQVVQNHAYGDVIFSAKLGVVPWNRPCMHYTNLDSIRDDFRRLTAPNSSVNPGENDVRLLRQLCRCCVRLLPTWTEDIALAVDACFLYPDQLARGLLWRMVVFAVRMDSTMGFGIEVAIKSKIARFLEADGEFASLIVDGFIDALESNCIAADIDQKAAPTLS